MVWRSFENFASSRSLTCAGSPENLIYSRPLKIKPSGGLTKQQESVSGEGLWLPCLHNLFLLCFSTLLLLPPLCPSPVLGSLWFGWIMDHVVRGWVAGGHLVLTGFQAADSASPHCGDVFRVNSESVTHSSRPSSGPCLAPYVLNHSALWWSPPCGSRVRITIRQVRWSKPFLD